MIGGIVAIEILYSIIDFSRGNLEIFVTLLIAALGFIYWAISLIIKRFRNLNNIYLVHGKKSSSIKPQNLTKRTIPADYYELDEYHALKGALKSEGHVLVLGAPLAGKTWAIYQALKTMSPAANVIIPRLKGIDDLEKFVVPFSFAFWRKNILVLDDIDKFTEIQNFRYMVDEFLKNNTVIVASCRTGNEFEKLCKNEWLYPLFKKKNIVEFPENIPEEKGNEIAAKIQVEWNPAIFDGKIGSLVMPLEPMKNRFTECSNEEKVILKSIRILYKAGIYQENENFSFKRIEHLCKNLFGISLEKYRFEELLSTLQKKNFIKIMNDETVWAEDAYLNYVIEAHSIEREPLNFFNKIKDYFLRDSEALLSIGNRAYSIGTTDINKKYYMYFSISAHQEALKIRTLDRFPMDYAMTQNNLGAAYQTLAEVENKAENCKKSIAAFEEALKVRTLDRFPMDYAMTQNNLGNAYRILAEVENKAENCKKSIAAYEEALKVRTLDRFPMDYSMTQNNLGNAYGTLAEVENKAENCKKSIAAFEEALKVRTLDRFPMDYSMTQNNLGNAYQILAEVENKAENCKKSIAAYEEALKVYTLDRFPMQCAATQNNLGAAYQTLAEVENKAENCKKSIAAFEEALKIRTLDRFPIQYAMTQNNLGIVYKTLAGFENKAENCKKSIAAYEKALKIFTKDDFPEPYKVISRNLERVKTFCPEQLKMFE